MKDRFRFRLWDAELQTYFFSNDDGSLQFDIEKVLDGLTVHEGEVLEQCTGLKDKNGRLIYEGDILATSNKDTRYDLWEPEDWGYSAIYWNEKNLCFSGTKWFIDGPEEESVFNAEFVEVVGNIHENPELLEEKE